MLVIKLIFSEKLPFPICTRVSYFPLRRFKISLWIIFTLLSLHVFRTVKCFINNIMQKKLTDNHKIINVYVVCWNWRQGSGVALRNLISLHMDGNPITQMYLRYILFVYLLTSTSLYAYSTLSGYREIYRIRSYTAWLTACFPVWSSHGEIVLGMIKTHMKC